MTELTKLNLLLHVLCQFVALLGPEMKLMSHRAHSLCTANTIINLLVVEKGFLRYCYYTRCNGFFFFLVASTLDATLTSISGLLDAQCASDAFVQ